MAQPAARNAIGVAQAPSRRRRDPRLHLVLVALVGCLSHAAACGGENAPNPFVTDGGATSGGGGNGGDALDAGPDADPTLGAPCVDDSQCNDGVDCTMDRCDAEVERCRFSPDDSVCQNQLYCDGIEICDPKLGCKPGDPTACSDDSLCTIDACQEEGHSCSHAPRDADEDGDPDGHCANGGDCDESDPTVSSKRPEVCRNGKDDDCDGSIDEGDCSQPEHDNCLDPLEIHESGSFAMNTTAATFDYASSCMPDDPLSTRDVVAALFVAGGPVDVEIAARTAGTDVTLTLAQVCGDPSSEIVCSPTFATIGGPLAKIRARGLGGQREVAYPLYVNTRNATPISLDVRYLPAEPAPENETCGTAEELTPGEPVTAVVIGTENDLATQCDTTTGDLVYSFTIDEEQDVDVYATSIDGDGLPAISLRSEACALPEDEIACHTAQTAHVFRHAMPPGTYYVGVAATAPTEIALDVELSSPTDPPLDEDCSDAPVLPHDETIAVDLGAHQDDASFECIAGAVDAAYTLELQERSDVLLVERVSSGDTASVALALPGCAARDLEKCNAGFASPVRAAAHDVPAGDHRVVVESMNGSPVELTAFVRAAVPATLVPFADGCGDALDIPPSGGFFQGNTANATANHEAGCDQGALPAGGAPDQLLRLVLTEPKRVVLDMTGSNYSALLDVRKGPDCPGTEVLHGCTVGAQQAPFLDLELDAGTYFFQIDGFALDAGPWFLDVRVVDF